MKVGHSIRWNALHWGCIIFVINQHPGNNCVLFIELFSNRHVYVIKQKITTVFLFKLLQFDYEVWEIIIYFTICFSFWCFCSIFSLPTKNLYIYRSWTILIYWANWQKHIFFCWRIHNWVITIVVVLDKSTVIFQKKGGVVQFVSILGGFHSFSIFITNQ